MLPGTSADSAGSRGKRAFHPLIETGLLALSAILFSLSFPNILSEWGFGPLAYLALLPLFLVVNRTTWPRVFFYGILYGAFAYGLFNYWLAIYHPLAILIVPAFYAVAFLVLLPLLKLVRDVLPRSGWLVQVALWVGWEYLRIQGFLGYPYGIMGYSQFLVTPLVNLASLTGVWGPSAIVVAPSVLAAWAFRERGSPSLARFGVLRKLRAILFPASVYLAIFAAALVYGTLSQIDFSAAPTKKLVLVQQNVDPWIGGVKAYRESLERLMAESKKALDANSGVDAVLWSETSFIPALEYQENSEREPERVELVNRLREFLRAHPVPFVFGNGETVPYKNEKGKVLTKNYNAVLVYQGDSRLGSYRKIHLVPFTESFPFASIFPGIYQALIDTDTSLWDAGSDYTVLEAAGMKFGTPICFEDSFGESVRAFVANGAQVILNLSNDSWSKSVAAEMQHAAMAVFRTAETRRAMVRSTNGGMSMFVDPNARIQSMNQPFTLSSMVVNVPLVEGHPTPYMSYGDVWGLLALLLGMAALVATIGVKVTQKLIHRRKID